MIVFDIEANGLNPDKIHCLSAKPVGGKMKSTTSYDNMRSFLRRSNVLIGHNIIRYDIPVLKRILGASTDALLVDTLALSWYLEPKRVRHGLESYGEDFGIPKPVIEDWDSLTPEEYIHRCEEDVEINTTLWNKQWKKLLKLYGSEEEAMRFIEYLSFKMDCAREQEERRWKLNIPLATTTLDTLTIKKDDKIDELMTVMPKVAEKAKKGKPKKPFKQDGSWSVTGTKWFNLLEEKGLPQDYDGVVEVVTGYKEPNPGSHVQIKDWLYSHGWVPETFEFKRDKETGDVRKIPQVGIKNSGGMLCPSIHKLFDVEPKLKVLEGLSILTHRISLVQGFLDNVDDQGYIKAEIQGLTNTLRFKHKVLVNLPGVDKAYGEEIRGCLIAPDGYELCGSDKSSLEDRTKQHYMYPHDPEYVEEMQAEDFDPHTNLAVFAKALTREQEQDIKEGGKTYAPIRKVYKAVNYACVYGAGGATVGRSAGVSTSKGDKLVEAYWKRNWAVQAIADEQIVKTVGGQKWLYNPVSKFWYSLRHEKDRFSTLNQGTGVYCFDTWVKHVRSKGLPIIGQFHDEIIALIRKGLRDVCTRVLRWAVDETNKELGLNVKLDISIDFGDSYAEIH